MQQASKKIGVGVPKEAQDIFNAIENMYVNDNSVLFNVSLSISAYSN